MGQQALPGATLAQRPAPLDRLASRGLQATDSRPLGRRNLARFAAAGGWSCPALPGTDRHRQGTAQRSVTCWAGSAPAHRSRALIFHGRSDAGPRPDGRKGAGSPARSLDGRKPAAAPASSRREGPRPISPIAPSLGPVACCRVFAWPRFVQKDACMNHPALSLRGPPCLHCWPSQRIWASGIGRAPGLRECDAPDIAEDPRLWESRPAI